jgi:hypothetical protein
MNLKGFKRLGPPEVEMLTPTSGFRLVSVGERRTYFYFQEQLSPLCAPEIVSLSIIFRILRFNSTKSEVESPTSTSGFKLTNFPLPCRSRQSTLTI